MGNFISNKIHLRTYKQAQNRGFNHTCNLLVVTRKDLRLIELATNNTGVSIKSRIHSLVHYNHILLGQILHMLHHMYIYITQYWIIFRPIYKILDKGKLYWTRGKPSPILFFFWAQYILYWTGKHPVFSMTIVFCGIQLLIYVLTPVKLITPHCFIHPSRSVQCPKYTAIATCTCVMSHVIYLKRNAARYHKISSVIVDDVNWSTQTIWNHRQEIGFRRK